MDFELIGIGAAFVLIGLATFVWPQAGLRTEEERSKRLAELNQGAPEKFFEERRELASHPQYYMRQKPARILAVLMLVSGALMIVVGVI